MISEQQKKQPKKYFRKKRITLFFIILKFDSCVEIANIIINMFNIK